MPPIRRLYMEGKVKPVCPECLAHLPIPRCPSEIVGGDGRDVLAGTARVMSRDGRDITNAFLHGARAVLEAAQRCGARRAYLKSKSPSCGVRAIYDGTFTHTLKEGKGVAAALLEQNGIEVVEI